MSGNKINKQVNVHIENMTGDVNILKGTDFDSAMCFNSPPFAANTFHFAAENVDLVGRTTELIQLKAFCGYNERMCHLEDKPKVFSWWVVTGEGASGKSRLCFEFGKTLREYGWNVCYPPLARSYHDLKQCASQLTRNYVYSR